jgi:hypothetical protein
MSEQILTSEEKKYLRSVGRYVQSFGSKYGEIDVELSDYNGLPTEENITLDYISHFDNNRKIEVPPRFKLILEKIFKYIEDNINSYDFPDLDYISANYAKVEIWFDAEEEYLKVDYVYYYYESGEPSQTDYNLSDNGVEKIFQELSNVDEIADDDEELVLKYNGSGDIGYTEGSFENGAPVPASVEDWCYNRLESEHGGWEINEGSDGSFYFNMRTKTITLNHTYNEEESETVNLFEEKFSD